MSDGDVCGHASVTEHNVAFNPRAPFFQTSAFDAYASLFHSLSISPSSKGQNTAAKAHHVEATACRILSICKHISVQDANNRTELPISYLRLHAWHERERGVITTPEYESGQVCTQAV